VSEVREDALNSGVRVVGELAMLTAIKGLFSDRRDRQELLNLRAIMVNIHKLLFPEHAITGQLVRAKTGWR
jgi:hypothetical protein